MVSALSLVNDALCLSKALYRWLVMVILFTVGRVAFLLSVGYASPVEQLAFC